MPLVFLICFIGVIAPIFSRDVSGDDFLAVNDLWHDITTPHLKPAARKKLRRLLPAGGRLELTEDCYLNKGGSQDYLKLSCLRRDIRLMLRDIPADIQATLQSGERFSGSFELVPEAGPEKKDAFDYGEKHLQLFARPLRLEAIAELQDVIVPAFLNSDSARLWEIRNGEGLLCILPDGEHFLSQTHDSGIIVREFATGKTVNVIRGLTAVYSALCGQPGIAYVHVSDGLWILNTQDWQYKELIRNQPAESMQTFSVSPDGRTIVYCAGKVAQQKSICRLWREGNVVTELPMDGTVHRIVATKSNHWTIIEAVHLNKATSLILNTDSGKTSIIDKATAADFEEILPHPQADLFVIVARKYPEERWAVKLLNPADLTMTVFIPPGPSSISHLRMAPDMKKSLVYGGREGIYESTPGKKPGPRRFKDEIRHFKSFEYFPDKRLMLTHYIDDPAITLWNLDAPVKVPSATKKVVGEVFSASGRQLEVIGANVQKLRPGSLVSIETKSGPKRAKVAMHFHTKVRCLAVGSGAGIAKGDRVVE